MQSEIITVGSELLAGETVDLHSSYLSRELHSLGIDVQFHTSVGDDAQKLHDVISLARTRSQLIFLCGGLGPTMDDLTKETVSEVTGVPLVEDPEVKRRLEKYFEGQMKVVPANNYKQTYVFSGGVVFQNHHGTAPGLALQVDGITYVLLPGPPGELVPMFEKQVLPFLLREVIQEGQVILAESLSFFGLGESLLEEKIADLIRQQDNPVLATYAKESGVVLRITAWAPDEAEARQLIDRQKAKVLTRIGEYCYSEQGETLEEVVVAGLIRHQKTVAVAESCTGGKLAHLLTSVPGSSRAFKGGWVTYTNEVKEKIASVPAEYLNEYGAISAQTAEIMAQNTLERFDSDFALGVTGVAGPDPAEAKPVGTVFIGLAEKGQPVRVYQFALKGSRRRIQLLAANHALFVLEQCLKKGETTR